MFIHHTLYFHRQRPWSKKMDQGCFYSLMALARWSVLMGNPFQCTSSTETSNTSSLTRASYVCTSYLVYICMCIVCRSSTFWHQHAGILLCRLENNPHHLPRWTWDTGVPKVRVSVHFYLLRDHVRIASHDSLEITYPNFLFHIGMFSLFHMQSKFVPTFDPIIS